MAEWKKPILKVRRRWEDRRTRGNGEKGIGNVKNKTRYKGIDGNVKPGANFDIIF